MPAVVYRITNLVNGKFYIGVTTQQPPAKRFREHIRAANYGADTHFYKAIRKYGEASFSFEVLVECASAEIGLGEEVRLIAEMRPQYNATKGGDGRVGVDFSKDGRQRVIDAHKGNKYRLGKKHSEKTINLLKQLGLTEERKAKFAVFSHLGPKAIARRVVCLNDGCEFESTKAAAQHYGVQASSITEICRRNRKRSNVAGMVFRYIGDTEDADEAIAAAKDRRAVGTAVTVRKLMKPVVCLDDGLIYPSAIEAGAAYGIHRFRIGEVCRGRRAHARGLRFSYEIPKDEVT